MSCLPFRVHILETQVKRKDFLIKEQATEHNKLLHENTQLKKEVANLSRVVKSLELQLRQRHSGGAKHAGDAAGAGQIMFFDNGLPNTGSDHVSRFQHRSGAGSKPHSQSAASSRPMTADSASMQSSGFGRSGYGASSRPRTASSSGLPASRPTSQQSAMSSTSKASMPPMRVPQNRRTAQHNNKGRKQLVFRGITSRR